MAASKKFWLSVLASGVMLLLLPGCRIHTSESDGSGNKKVDIQTPVADLHVDEGAKASETGLPLYPGAQLAPKNSEHDSKSANINMSALGFGLKIVALHYQSEDSSDKVAAFYMQELKKYGPVVQCRTSKPDPDVRMDHGSKKSDQLTCDGDDNGKTIELKVGSENNQRIVAISPKDKGSEFALVRVQLRTGETI